MKKVSAIFLVLAAFCLLAFAPLPQAEPGELPSGLVVILSSVLIPVVVQALKWIAAWFGVVWKEGTLMVICFVLGAGVALIWLMPTFPAFPVFAGDPADVTKNVIDWLGGALSVIGSVFGLATFIYRFILAAVFKALGFGSENLRSLAEKSE